MARLIPHQSLFAAFNFFFLILLCYLHFRVCLLLVLAFFVKRHEFRLDRVFYIICRQERLTSLVFDQSAAWNSLITKNRLSSRGHRRVHAIVHTDQIISAIKK